MSQALSPAARKPFLVARPRGEGEPGGPEFSKPAILRAVARKGLPNLIEATVIPAILFYVLVVSVGNVVAIVAAMAWGCVAVLRRLAFRQPVPSI
ncbi:MAG: hypothetical protein ACXWAY_14740, partial [Acidimicrobiia bacterium]